MRTLIATSAGALWKTLLPLMMGALLTACGGGTSERSANDASSSNGALAASSDLTMLAPKVSSNAPTNIAAWGDSMTSGIDDMPYPKQMQALLPGRTIYNGGVGGQSSTAIAARMGAVPLTITVEGNTIPASGSVRLQSLSIPVVDEQSPGGVYGSVLKVPGYLERIPDLTPNVVRFVRTGSGTQVTVLPDTPFVVNTEGRETWISVLWMGTNNFYDPDQVIKDINASVNFLKKPNRRFVVLSVVNSTERPKGSEGYNTTIGLNTRLAALYPSNYIDIRSFLISQYDPQNPQDLIDVANDVLPSSLRYDSIHLNPKGNALVAKRVADFIKAKGW